MRPTLLLIPVAIALSGFRTTAQAQPAPAAPAPGPTLWRPPEPAETTTPPTGVDTPVVEPAPLPTAVIVPAPPPVPPPLAGPTQIAVKSVEYDDGRHVDVSWTGEPPEEATVVLLRRPAGGAAAPLDPFDTVPKQGDAHGDWTVAYAGTDPKVIDEVKAERGVEYQVLYVVDDNGTVRASGSVLSAPVTPVASWFDLRRLAYLVMILMIGGAVAVYVQIARRRGKDMYIRRIAGVDAIEDAVGRSTEMGRPVLYVTGLEEIQDIQTIASLLILGHVATLTASYDTELKVANYYPLTMVVAEEVVRQGYANAGRLDAHRPENVMFITAEQFAFAAGVNGMILRDQPAVNIYFGKFFGESLLLAETGFLTGAVQIAGTAEFTQLPFFIAACDYTLIGEELYATSAYLSREPTLLANLKAGDFMKLLAMIFIVAGAALATIEWLQLGNLVFP